MSDLPKYPPDGLNTVELQVWAAAWSAMTRRTTGHYIRESRYMSIEDWLSGACRLHWEQEIAAKAYRRAREG